MMRRYVSDTYGPLAARSCLSAVFLYSGFAKLLDVDAGTAEVAGLGVPLPGLALALTILAQIGGGLMVLTGFAARFGALVLAGFTIVATLMAHWPIGLEGDAFARQLTVSLEHLAIVGGFSMVIFAGPGALSLDTLRRRSRSLSPDAHPIQGE